LPPSLPRSAGTCAPTTRQAERLLAMGHALTGDDLIFCDAASEPL
jgi:hypothetical protein